VPFEPVSDPAGNASPKFFRLPSTKYSLSAGNFPNRPGEDGRHLVERDQRDRVRVGSQHFAELRGEDGVTRVVRGRRDDLATGGLEGLR
jgi:hypothetical protein